MPKKTISLTSPEAIKAACLRGRSPAPDGSSYPYEMDYFSPHGRMFTIREMDDGTYFLSEMKPIGRRVIGEGSNSVADHRITELMDDPNGLRDALRSLGIDDDRVVRMGGGFTVGSIFYSTLDEACEAISRSLRDNAWYESVDYGLRADPEFQREQKAFERAWLREHDQAVLEQHKAAVANEHGIFKGLHSTLGPLEDDTKKRLLSFLNDPTEENWERVYSLCIKGFKTVWQAWSDVDPNAPSTKGDEGWPRIPDRETFIHALRTAAGEPELSVEDPEEDLGDEGPSFSL